MNGAYISHKKKHAITSTRDHSAGNHKVFYTNSSGEIVELALGSIGQLLQSNGASSAPVFANPSLFAGVMINGKITTSVSSNNLTVAVKTLAGNDPSASDPVLVRIGDSIRAITGALSITRNAGTNWATAGSSELAGQDLDWFAYLAWDSANSAVRLGFSLWPFGRIYSDLSSTSTNQLYIAFDTAPGTSDEMVVVGRFNASLSAAASHNWSIPATSIVISRPIYETRKITYTPTYGTSDSMTYTSVVTNYAYYIITGRALHIYNHSQGTIGGTMSNTVTATMPFTNPSTTLTTGTAAASFTSGNISGGAGIFWDASGKTANFRGNNAGNLTAGTRQFAAYVTAVF